MAGEGGAMASEGSELNARESVLRDVMSILHLAHTASR